MIWKRIKGVFGGGEDESSSGKEPKKPHQSDAETGSSSAAEPVEITDAQLLQNALGRYRNGDEVAAIALVRNRLRENGPSAMLSLWLGETLLVRGQLEEAEEPVRELVESGPEESDRLRALRLLGEIYEELGQPERALAAYEGILAVDVEYPQVKARAAELRRAAIPQSHDVGATLAASGALAGGRYRIEAELGRGGAGTVFVARDERLSRRVALKVYHRQGKAELKRLFREARPPAQLEHPGIIRILDIQPELHAIIMEYLPAKSLKQLGPETSIDALRPILASSARALQFVHRAGFVHRDIKPSNILLRNERQAVLTDFGLTRKVGETSNQPGGEGTLRYMSPEQRSDAPSSAAMDLYSLGKAFEEVLGERVAPKAWKEAIYACLGGEAGRPSAAELANTILG